MASWEHHRLKGVPSGIFQRALQSFDVLIEPGKRTPPGMFELQRGALYTHIYIPEGHEELVPPLNIETVCKALDLDVLAFYARAKQQIEGGGAAVAPLAPEES